MSSKMHKGLVQPPYDNGMTVTALDKHLLKN
jgi:hypothetical protein